MNCDRFHQRALSAPYDLDAECTAHMNGCEACAAALARIRRDDRVILATIAAIENPALVERLKTIPTVTRAPRKRRPLMRAMAAAACLALAIIGVQHYVESAQSDAMTKSILAHIDAHPNEFHAVGGQSMEEQSKLLGKVGLDLKQLGELRPARVDHCKINEMPVVHMVVEVGQIEAVMFVLPEDFRHTEIDAANRFAVLTRKNDRTIAVVTRTRENADRILESMAHI